VAEYWESLPLAEFGFPGPLRDRLIAAILAGEKTSTSSTVIEYSVENEPFPMVGLRETVVDSAGIAVGVIEITGVERIRVSEATPAHAIAEGEGYATVDGWRAAHVAFWESDEMRGSLGMPGFTITDDTEIFAVTFRLVDVLGSRH
jgi:uncharacterized protein YhfF